MKRKRKIVFCLLGLLLIATVVVLGDYLYSRAVTRAVERWEATIQRDANGVQTGANDFFLKGNDTALLLVHGFNDTPQAYARMAPALREQGYTVLAVRLPGFGVPVEKMHDCTCEQWIGKVTAEARALRETCSRVIVVGHSLGGAVALGSLTDHPELFDAAVLLAPAIEVSNRRSPVFPTRFWRKFGDLLLHFSTVYQSPYDRNDSRDPRYRNPPGKPAFSTRNIVQQTFRLIDRNRGTAPAIQVPVLMILSRDDQVIDWAAAEQYFTRLGSPVKQLRFYDESGHALTVDYDRENVTRDIVAFTRSLIRPSEPGSRRP